MLISHIHKDHFSLEQIKKLSPNKLYLGKDCIESLNNEKLSSEIIEVKTGDQININDFKILIFDVDHGPNVKAPVESNFGYLIEVDNKKIYYAGEMFYQSGIDVTSLEVDYVIIPIGGYYTFGPKEALTFLSKFKKIGNITPMHYQKNPEIKEEFVKLAVACGINAESIIF